jgi:hypothetical protein
MEFRHRNRTIAEDEAKWEADADKEKAREADEARKQQALVHGTQVAEEDLTSLERGRARLMYQIEQSQETIDRCRDLIREIDQLLAKSGLKP